MNNEQKDIARLAKAAIEKDPRGYGAACSKAISKDLFSAENSAHLFVPIAMLVCLSQDSTAKVAYSLAKEYSDNYASIKPRVKRNSSKPDDGGYSTSKKEIESTKDKMAYAYIDLILKSGKKLPSEVKLIELLKRDGVISESSSGTKFLNYFRKIKG